MPFQPSNISPQHRNFPGFFQCVFPQLHAIENKKSQCNAGRGVVSVLLSQGLRFHGKHIIGLFLPTNPKALSGGVWY